MSTEQPVVESTTESSEKYSKRSTINEATPPHDRTYTLSEKGLSRAEKQDRKMKRRKHRRQTLAKLAQQEDQFLEQCA